MKKDFKEFLLLLFVFLLFGTFISFSLYQRIKSEFIINNEILASNLLEKYPMLEHDLVKILADPKEKEEGMQILKKYGLSSLESLDYLKSFENFKVTFFGTCVVFYFLFSSFFLLYFYSIEKKRKEEIGKIDRYLFSLLSEEIQVDLKDFQSGELESLQNDLMKVTSRLKNALEHSTSSSKELSKTLADISHQLKTPLTSLSIIHEALQSSSMDEPTRSEFLSRQEDVINHMQTLVINLLKVSQIESGMIELKKEIVDMRHLLHTSLEELDLLLVSKTIDVRLQVAENITVIGDFTWMKEAILNILKNGIEHSLENGKLEVTCTDTPLFTELLIQDYGEGISKADLPHIFERFYKTSKDSLSVGIGLNLSKSIFDRMNATVKVKSKVGEYTIFMIHFYKSIV